MALDSQKLDQLLGRGIVDFGATFHAALVAIGDKLGLYKALAAGGPMTSTQLAERTNTNERYVREWLASQAAGGYVTYDPNGDRFSLTERAGLHPRRRKQPSFLARCVSSGPRGHAFRGTGLRTLSKVAMASAGTSTIRSFSPGPSVLPARLCRASGQLVDSRARGCGCEAARGWPSCRRGLRPRRLHHSDGAGLSHVNFRGV